MVTQKDLETLIPTLMHLAGVRSFGRIYDKARSNNGFLKSDSAVKKPDHEIRTNLLNAMYLGNEELIASSLHDSPEEISRKYNAMVDLETGELGKKAKEEFIQHGDKVLESYLKSSNEKIEGYKKDKKKIDDDAKVEIYSSIGNNLRELAQDGISRAQIKNITETGSKEEKQVLDQLLSTHEDKDLDEYRTHIQNNYASISGDKTYGLHVPDAIASSARTASIEMAIRKAGKYFLTDDLKLDQDKFKKFFGNSPYAIARMATELPKE